MSAEKLKAFIGKFAPGIATALGGPLAGMATKGLCSAFGLDENATLDDVEKMMKNGQLSGDQLVALKNEERQFMLKMKELDINSVRDLEEIYAKDRDSARQREIQTGDHTPRYLAYGVTVGFFGILAYIMKFEVPASSRDILNIMLGALGTAWVGVITYYFGSSMGSKTKDELLFKSQPAVPAPTPEEREAASVPTPPREPRDRK